MTKTYVDGRHFLRSGDRYKTNIGSVYEANGEGGYRNVGGVGILLFWQSDAGTKGTRKPVLENLSSPR